jgi:hypothetical protein
MRDDDGPAPGTPASTSGAAICRRISGAGHQIDLLDRSNRLAPAYPRVKDRTSRACLLPPRPRLCPRQH